MKVTKVLESARNQGLTFLACSRQQRSTETWAIVLNLAKFILDVFRSLSKTIQYYFFEKETERMIQNLRCNLNAAF